MHGDRKRIHGTKTETQTEPKLWSPHVKECEEAIDRGTG